MVSDDSLDDLRGRIDEIDQQLQDLLIARTDLALEIAYTGLIPTSSKARSAAIENTTMVTTCPKMRATASARWRRRSSL